MKRFTFISAIISLLFLTNCGTLINPRYVKQSAEVQKEYQLQPLSTVKEYYNNPKRIYAIDASMLKKIIQESPQKYVVAVFGASWCGPCHQNMPIIRQYIDANKKDINAIFISTSDWLEKAAERAYIDKYQFKDYPLLVVDIYKYGTEFNNWNRLIKFSSELLPHPLENAALPTYLLFNNKGKFITKINAPFNTKKLDKILVEN